MTSMSGANARLDAIVLFVRDIGASIKWYRDVFEMKVDEIKPPYFSQLSLGGMKFYIETPSPERQPGFRGEVKPNRTPLVFLVTDMNATITRAVAAGGKIVVAPVQQEWGNTNAVVADLDGNELILEI